MSFSFMFVAVASIFLRLNVCQWSCTSASQSSDVAIGTTGSYCDWPLGFRRIRMGRRKITQPTTASSAAATIAAPFEITIFEYACTTHTEMNMYFGCLNANDLRVAEMRIAIFGTTLLQWVPKINWMAHTKQNKSSQNNYLLVRTNPRPSLRDDLAKGVR